MILSVQMGNTKPEERLLTLNFLQNCGAMNLKVVPQAYEGADEFTFELAVDDDNDVRRALAVMLFYNDRQPDEIARFLASIELPKKG